MVRKVPPKLIEDEPPSSPQPEPRYIIQALLEENKQLNDSKLYMLALLNQVQTEYVAAQSAWEAERDSLMKSKAG